MDFKQAIKKLGIEEYGERIFYSNSHGELSHLYDYILLAEMLKEDIGLFKDWFGRIVKFAEENWERPESIFQHIPRALKESIKGKAINNNKKEK